MVAVGHKPTELSQRDLLVCAVMMLTSVLQSIEGKPSRAFYTITNPYRYFGHESRKALHRVSE